MRWLTAMALTLALLSASPARAAGTPRYDVPRGFARCADAVAWHEFFKWASVRHATCDGTARFLRAYARRAHGAGMPHHVAGYDCRIHYWRDEDGNAYASRHVCTRDAVTIRFYGMS